jgi:hypothetical protein
MDVLLRLKTGESAVNTGKTRNLPASTVCTIRASRARSGAVEKTEQVLAVRKEDLNHLNSHVILMVIQRQAKYSFNDLISMVGEGSVNEEFKASGG